MMIRHTYCLLLLSLIYSIYIGNAHAALYWFQNVHGSQVSVCFVGDAASSRPDRVTQIRNYIREFEYYANIKFTVSDNCPAVTIVNGKEYYDGDIRVVIPGISVSGTGAVPGKDCPMFKDASNNYNNGNNGWGSWSNAPDDLDKHRGCLYNLKLGDDPWNDTPYLSHTLHEFGHNMGLSHEHLRFDVEKNWVLYYFRTMNDVNNTKANNIYSANYRNLDQIADDSLAHLKNILGISTDNDAQKLKMDATFLTKIPGVTVNIARTIYDADFRRLADVQKADVNKLQTIPGYSNLADAQQLKDNANTVSDKRFIYGGGITNGFITSYDRHSVMHYKYDAAGIDGNYSFAGFSSRDQLALHVLYPEKVRIAEVFGTTVIKAGKNLQLWSDWKARGGVMSYIAKNYQWKLDGQSIGSSPNINLNMNNIGNFTIEYRYNDFLDRSYRYSDNIRVLSNGDYNRLMGGVVSATLPLLTH